MAAHKPPRKQVKRSLDTTDPWVEGEERTKAYALLRRLMASGSLVPPSRCSRCGKKEVHFHHEDYRQPLQVQWVCARCHSLLHHGRIVLDFYTQPLHSDFVRELRNFAYRHPNWKTVAGMYGISIDEVKWYLSPQCAADRKVARKEMMRAQWLLELRARHRKLLIVEYLIEGHTYEEAAQEFDVARKAVVSLVTDVFRVPLEFKTLTEHQRVVSEANERKWRRNSYKNVRVHKEVEWDWDKVAELEETKRFTRFRELLDSHVQHDLTARLKKLYVFPDGISMAEEEEK